ncbi:MAG TPA: cobalamin-dependent protein [Xanthobacteraceae bacterium]
MEVIYTGLHRTPDEVVTAVLQEDVDVLGVGLLSGAQMTVFPKIFARLKKEGVDDVIVVVGGVMPAEDVAALKQMGVKAVMLQDSLAAGHRRHVAASCFRARSAPRTRI